MRPVLERLGLNPLIVEHLTKNELHEMIRANGKTLMYMFHPDRGGGESGFMGLRRDLNHALEGDIEELSQELVEKTGLKAGIAPKLRELSRARAYLASAVRFGEKGYQDDDAWLLARARDWTRTFFSDVFSGIGLSGLRNIAGMQIRIASNPTGTRRTNRKVKKVTVDNLMAVAMSIDPDKLEADIEAAKAELEADTDKIRRSYLNVSIRNNKKELERYRSILKELASLKEEQKGNVVDNSRVIPVGMDLSVMDAGRVIGSCPWKRPAFLSLIQPYLSRGKIIICLDDKGSLSSQAYFLGAENRGIGQEEKGDSSDSSIVSVTDYIRHESNPLLALGISSRFLAGLEPQQRVEFVKAHSKNLLVLLRRSRGEDSRLGRQMTSLAEALKKDADAAALIEEYLSQGELGILVGEIDAKIKEITEMERESALFIAKQKTKELSLKGLRTQTEAYIAMLFESVYGEGKFSREQPGTLLLHKAEGALLEVAGSRGKEALIISKQGLDMLVNWQGRDVMVLGSADKELDRTPMEMLDTGNLGRAHSYSIPGLAEGRELLVIVSGKVERAGRITQMEGIGDLPDSRQGYTSVIKRMREADIKRKKQVFEKNLFSYKKKLSL